MSEQSGNQFDGELSALQHQRKMDSLSSSPIANSFGSIAEIVGEFGVPGAGLFAKALKASQTPIETMMAQLETAAYEEILRIGQALKGHDDRLNTFEERIKSQEAKAVYFSAVMLGLRTSDAARHSRLARVTINSIYENDIEPEGLDGLMRAAVDLRLRDIDLLKKFYNSREFLSRLDHLDNSAQLLKIPELWKHFIQTENIQIKDIRSSLVRLQACGLIQQRLLPGLDAGTEMYLLLPEGIKFYERFQEISKE